MTTKKEQKGSRRSKGKQKKVPDKLDNLQNDLLDEFALFYDRDESESASAGC